MRIFRLFLLSLSGLLVDHFFSFFELLETSLQMRRLTSLGLLFVVENVLVSLDQGEEFSRSSSCGLLSMVVDLDGLLDN